jgi:predicted secreted Zn-dependent protease
MTLHKPIVNPTACVRSSLRRLTAAAVLCFVVEASAQDSLVITTNYFNVSGGSEHALRRSINQARPWSDKREGDAFTEWKIEWNFRLTTSQSACHVHSFATRTAITITLPKWTPPPAAPRVLTQGWDRYVTALKAHEEGHKQIALAAAAEIQKRVKALKTEPTCEAMSALLNGTARSVITEYRQKEIDYDRKTDHGATQGARFP